MKKGSGAIAFKKVALDQLAFTPFYLGALLTSLGFIQTKDIGKAIARVERDYADILLMNYKVWPAVQFCNFSFVPLQYQVLLVQFIAIFWNTYLSWKTSQVSSKRQK